MATKKVVEALQEAGRRLRESIVDRMIGEGLLKTGALGRSIQDKVTENDNGSVSLEIEMLNYGIFQDSGVKGTKGWGRPNTNQTFVQSAESLFPPGQFVAPVIAGPLPFPARKLIAEYGLKPRPFIVPAITQNQEYIQNSLTEAAGEDISVEINDLAKKYGAEVIL